LLQNTHFRADSEVAARLACHRDPTRLGGVLELAMTSPLGDLNPAIGAEPIQHL
jgi:hypothetical protein